MDGSQTLTRVAALGTLSRGEPVNLSAWALVEGFSDDGPPRSETAVLRLWLGAIGVAATIYGS